MTTFNINQFRSSIGNGGARPNQYMVSLSFPPFVAAAAQATMRAPFLIHNASLPGVDQSPTTVMYRGREFHMTGDMVFQPMSLAFYNSDDMALRTAFEQWIDGQENFLAKFGQTNPSAYMRDVDIFQLDRNGTILKSYKLLDAFPINVSEIPLSFDQNNQVSSTTVTLRYQTYVFSNTVGSNANHTGVFSAGVNVGGINVGGTVGF